MRTTITVVRDALNGVAQGVQYDWFDVPGALPTRPFGVNASGAIVGL